MTVPVTTNATSAQSPLQRTSFQLFGGRSWDNAPWPEFLWWPSFSWVPLGCGWGFLKWHGKLRLFIHNLPSSSPFRGDRLVSQYEGSSYLLFLPLPFVHHKHPPSKSLTPLCLMVGFLEDDNWLRAESRMQIVKKGKDKLEKERANPVWWRNAKENISFTLIFVSLFLIGESKAPLEVKEKSLKRMLRCI